MSLRQRVFGVLFGGVKPWDTVFNILILLLVLMNVAMLITASVERIANENATFFFVAEAVSVGIFTVE